MTAKKKTYDETAKLVIETMEQVSTLNRTDSLEIVNEVTGCWLKISRSYYQLIDAESLTLYSLEAKDKDNKLITVTYDSHYVNSSGFIDLLIEDDVEEIVCDFYGIERRDVEFLRDELAMYGIYGMGV